VKIIHVLCALVALHGTAFSATIYVPDNFPTIQDAINASVNGDTVIVRPGTYVENIDFVGKAVTVTSEQGALPTTIDGNRAGSVVTFQSGENASSVLEGFTLTNGDNSDGGGGIHCLGSSSPTILNNTITGNTARRGGGIYVYHSFPAITNNAIMGNAATKRGGGICCQQFSSPTIMSNTLTGNSAFDGGGLYCHRSSPAITNNIIKENTAKYGAGIYCIDFPSSATAITKNTITKNMAIYNGGGIICYDSSPRITNNTITGNTAEHGGGVYCKDNCSPVIMSNTITSNTTSDRGAGICCDEYSSPVITNNTITENTALDGGGVCCYYHSSPVIANNTIAGNSAGYRGGGVLSYSESFPNITSTILCDNSALSGQEIWIGEILHPSALTISYSNVKGGQSSCYVDPNCTLNWGPGMIDADPLFADPANNDFHLTWYSPCRNTGDNNAVTELYDFEGDPRIAQGTVDMGADEFYYHLYHSGDVLPGASVNIEVVGIPGLPALIALGTGIKDPPLSTPHGDLWLELPLVNSWQLGAIPATGILTGNTTVPSGWPSGSEHPFQVLVGRWGGAYSKLTNMMVLAVD
jgi:parallel beta-helix repeat protein